MGSVVGSPTITSAGELLPQTALEAAATRRDNILLTVRTVDERQALRYAGLHQESMETNLSLAARPDAQARQAREYASRLEESRGALARVEEALAVDSAAVRRDLAARAVGHEEVRRSLPPGSALVGFRRYRDARYGTGAAAVDSYAAFVLAGAGRTPVCVRWASPLPSMRW